MIWAQTRLLLQNDAVNQTAQRTDGSLLVDVRHQGRDLDGNSVAYVLTDSEFSSNGSTWVDMSNSMGMQNFTSSWADYSFVWSVGVDLPNTEDSTVYARLRVQDPLNQSNQWTESVFAVDTKAPGSPSPLQDTVRTTNTIDLSWTASSDGNWLQYEIIYTTASPVQRPCAACGLETVLGASTVSSAIAGLQPNTTYYMNIWAVDSFGNTASATEISTTTCGLPASAVGGNKFEPASGATGVSVMGLDLKWVAASGAASYDAIFSSNKTAVTNGTAILCDDTVNTNCSVGYTLQTSTTYWWKVNSNTNCGDTTVDTSIYSFSTTSAVSCNFTVCTEAHCNNPGSGYYQSIQGAIDASSNTDTICVSNGAYTENIDFKGKAITVQSMNGAANAIIQANTNDSVVHFMTGETSTSILDGFTVKGGTYGHGGVGGGIYIGNGSPTIQNCTIRDNYTTTYSNGGGGIFVDTSGYVTLTNCNILSNKSRYGGGLRLMGTATDSTITSCLFRNNSGDPAASGMGGGLYASGNVTVDSSIFTDNLAGQNGGGIYLTNSKTLTITNTRISGNYTSQFDGGGFYLDDNTLVTMSNTIITSNYARYGGGILGDPGADMKIYSCSLRNNMASISGLDGVAIKLNGGDFVLKDSVLYSNAARGGGGIYMSGTFSVAAVIENTTFGRNRTKYSTSAWPRGGGINLSDATLNITNCTFSENWAFGGGGAIKVNSGTLTVKNSILYGDTADNGSAEIEGTATVTYSDVQGGYTGTGNINSDPLFVGSGDYHIVCSDPVNNCSPCIDRATSTGAPDHDIDKEARPYDYNDTYRPNNPSAYDMGSDEYRP